MFGRACGMPDYLDERHVLLHGWKPGDTRRLMQVQASRGAAKLLISGDKWCNDYAAVHANHFDWTPQKEERLFYLLAILHKATDEEIMEAGWLAHTFEDCGRPGCPHWKLWGIPHSQNYDVLKAGGHLAWYKQALPKGKCWGHAYWPAADEIQNCRDGAVAVLMIMHGQILGAKTYAIESPAVIAAQAAKNDGELAKMCRAAYAERSYLGRPMPEFTPFAGLEIEMFKRCTQ